jgi:glutathione S-transferase
MDLYGRSSSHFTRIPRIFAVELEVALDLHPIHDLMSEDPAVFGGHPALKMPTLHAGGEAWFGALPICRELARHSDLNLDITWPEDLADATASNTQELVLTAMSTGVGLIMGKASGAAADNAHLAKQRASLLGTLDWLEGHLSEALEALPAMRDLSFLEVSLFCMLEHLEFREVLSLAPYPALRAFVARFGARSAARATSFRYDAMQA